SEEFVRILRAILRIISGSAIAHSNIEKPIGSEFDHSPVVICVWLRNDEQHPFRRAGRVAVFGNDRRTIGSPGVIDEEPAIRGELWMESETENTLLAATQHPARNVEESCTRRGTRLHHADDAGLLENEQPVRTV